MCQEAPPVGGDIGLRRAGAADAWPVRMTESVMRRNPRLGPRWDYTSGLMLTAIAQVWRMTDAPRYWRYIKDNVDCFLDADGRISTYSMDEHNLDQINGGKVLLLLDEQTKDPRYRQALLTLREQLRTQPRTSEGGFWHKRIYPHQMWLDGLYMAAPFYAEWALRRGEPEAFADVAAQIRLLVEHTRDAETGLLYHGWDASKEQAWADPVTGCSRHFWGRAMGWFMMALVDVLDFLPAEHPEYPRIIAHLADAARAVANVQDARIGLWYQVLDHGTRPGNYLEASASCMFVYALAKGVRRGYLARDYLDRARQGYDGVIGHLTEAGADGNVNLKQICKVAGLGRYSPDQPYRDGSFAYYTGEEIVTNDYKGLGAFILAGVEMERAV